MKFPLFRFSLLGMPQMVGVSDGQSVELPLGKPLAALAYIVLAEGPVTREDLANLLWPSSAPDRARASVRQAIWLLRKQIHPDVLTEAEGRLAVAPGVLTHDLVELGELIGRGELDEAWALWRGGPLRGLAVSDAPAWEAWADDLRTRWERRFGEALETAVAGLPPEERLIWLDRALEVRPFRQSVHASTVRTLIELRREEAAEGALHRLRSVVDEPDPELVRELEEGLRDLKRRVVDGASDRLVPEFVGRSEELAELGSVWQSVLSARPRMVAVLGPAGIGKSRLAAELLRRASLDGAAVADASALDVERALELGVLATLVRNLLILPGAAGISAGSIEALHTLLPSERREGAHLHPATPTALSDALLDLLEAIAHEAPLVLLVEDVHWADSPSRTLLLRALRNLRGARGERRTTAVRWASSKDSMVRSAEASPSSVRQVHTSRGSTASPCPCASREASRALIRTISVPGTPANSGALCGLPGSSPTSTPAWCHSTPSALCSAPSTEASS